MGEYAYSNAKYHNVYVLTDVRYLKNSNYLWFYKLNNFFSVYFLISPLTIYIDCYVDIVWFIKEY